MELVLRYEFTHDYDEDMDSEIGDVDPKRCLLKLPVAELSCGSKCGKKILRALLGRDYVTIRNVERILWRRGEIGKG